MKFNRYDSLITAITSLFKKGFERRYKLMNKQLIDLKTKTRYTPKDLVIVECHHFDNHQQQNVMHTIFVVECKDNMRGLILSSYSDRVNMELINFMNKVKIKTKAMTVSKKGSKEGRDMAG